MVTLVICEATEESHVLEMQEVSYPYWGQVVVSGWWLPSSPRRYGTGPSLKGGEEDKKDFSWGGWPVSKSVEEGKCRVCLQHNEWLRLAPGESSRMQAGPDL